MPKVKSKLSRAKICDIILSDFWARGSDFSVIINAKHAKVKMVNPKSTDCGFMTHVLQV